ncbi:MAG TPA: glycogen/starch/alpha-glucan phosphorylase [Pseudolabrys sp.]|nr:glycogen/starch/alpha-glucan phosphorylase [Pseudolabrys sp.]
MATAKSLQRKLMHSPSPHGYEQARLREAIEAKLTYTLGKTKDTASDLDWYHATALAVRDRAIDIWMQSRAATKRERRKRVYYLSIEFLLGRVLFDTLCNLQLVDAARAALADLGVDLESLRDVEPDPALGNGGLGRLAACFMDSLSAVDIPAYGYGIRYENGLFEQRFESGWQKEIPENWLAHGNPWEFTQRNKPYSVGFGGTVEYLGGNETTARALWYPAERVLAVPHDTPVVGWRGRRVNMLRLWSARAMTPVQFAIFNRGDFAGAMAARSESEAISRFLYPDDSTREGRELRLRQEYFFTSASLQDLIRRHLEEFPTLHNLSEQAAIQLNDTHPAIAVAELMRILVDDHDIAWEQAWSITRATLSYTNHTLLPEALECWPTEIFGKLLPRHLQIIYLINWHHLQETERRGLHEPEFLSRVSLVEETGDKRIRMAHLAFIGSHTVNGVSQLHTDLLRKTVFQDLARTAATRVVNKTNGITFRRWLYEANRPLTELLVADLGERVLDEPECLRALDDRADDKGLVERFKHARLVNKNALATTLHAATGVRIDPHALFDVHIKRIHEYKRQILNILETIALYDEIRFHPDGEFVPRVKIFAGKAAAGYERAKLIIKLANDVAEAVNSDPIVGGRLKVVFVPNYNATWAERLIPAADLSEQISTAGMEASGTGNMKFALNGAITIGTLDGANIEIREHVGPDNIVIFGLTAEKVTEKRRGQFAGADAVAASPRLAAVIDVLTSGRLSPDDPQRFAPIVESLLGHDPFMVAADFDAYWQAQRRVDELWRSAAEWWRVSIANTARIGWFSSDRAIREYARDIWKVAAG